MISAQVGTPRPTIPTSSPCDLRVHPPFSFFLRNRSTAPQVSVSMPYNTLPTRPRHLSSSLMSRFSALSSSAESTSVHCFYCPKVLVDDSARRQHIKSTPNCSAAQHAALQREVERQQQLEKEKKAADRQEQDGEPSGTVAPSASLAPNKR